MADLKWKEAIIKVLEENKTAMHYTEIAELISEKGYRKSLGATPQDTVSSIMTTDINKNLKNSPFTRLGGGYYFLQKYSDNTAGIEELAKKKISNSEVDKIRIINAFGIYWDRHKVLWKTNPELIGIQQAGANEINFKDQIGIYLLHDSRETIYVGQAIEQSLGTRLKHHTTDRLGSRWDRFSWFGLYPVNDGASLNLDLNFDNLTIQDFGNLLEAVLIESIEPRQNRKQGNLFSGIEYLQKESSELKRKKEDQLLRELLDRR